MILNLENENFELQGKVEFSESTNSTNFQKEGQDFCPEMRMLIYYAKFCQIVLVLVVLVVIPAKLPVQRELCHGLTIPPTTTRY